MTDSTSLNYFFHSNAIPKVPYSFYHNYSIQEKGKNKTFDWSTALSYQNELFNYIPKNKQIIIEKNKPSKYISLEPIKYKKINDYKSPDFLLTITLFLFIFYSIINVYFKKYIRQFYSSFFNELESNRLFNDQNASLPTFYFLLNFISILIISLGLFQIFKNIDIFSNLGNMVLFSLSIGIVLLFLIYRYLIFSIAGWILDKRSIFKELIFQHLIYFKITSLILFPLFIVNIFLGMKTSNYIIFMAIFIFVLFQVMQYYRGTKIIIKKGIFIFYWILYLCIAEFIPFALLYKFLQAH